MKRFCLTIAAMAVMMGTVGSAAAIASPSASHHPTVSKATRTAQMAKLDARLSKLGNKRLSAQQLKSLGLRPASSADVARAKRMAGHGQARVANIGTTWFDWHWAGVSPLQTWIHTGFVGPYYSYPWYPYYYLFNDVYVCTGSDTGCQQADEYFYEYLVYYYPNGQWYTYGPSQYQNWSIPPAELGWGPYLYDEGV